MTPYPDRIAKFRFSSGPIGLRIGAVQWHQGGWILHDLYVFGCWVASFSHAANTARNPAEAYADCHGEVARKVLPVCAKNAHTQI